MDYDSRTKTRGLTERKGWSIIEKHGRRLYSCYKEQTKARNRKPNNDIETKARRTVMWLDYSVVGGRLEEQSRRQSGRLEGR